MASGTVSRLLDTRERFLADGMVDDCVRPEIHASWRRSRVSGVCADKMPDIPVDDYDTQSRLIRAATPVLDRLADQISDASVSIILTDENARILDRRVGVDSLTVALDGVLAVPGAHFSEEVVGTNGLGSTAETRRRSSFAAASTSRRSCGSSPASARPSPTRSPDGSKACST